MKVSKVQGSVLEAELVEHMRLGQPHRLTVADLEAGYSRDEWQGWGYLGERQQAMTTAAGRRGAARSDRAVLAEANRLGWTADQLFEWANSREGRHFADQALWEKGGVERAMGWGLGPGGRGLRSSW